MRKTFSLLALAAIVLAAAFTPLKAQYSGSTNAALDTVKAGRFDNGKMWTFDLPPKKYFQEAYNFMPDDAWFEHVRMSALRFANYCSASFVSEDGLVMTNHHCGRQSVTEAQHKGEDLHTNGFSAIKLSDERKIEELYVDQLVKIQDVTEEMVSAISKGKTELERNKIRDSVKKSIAAKYKKETNLECSVVSFYNGFKYSIYMYKRYKDVRLVFSPELQLGSYGGDPDNFTYPRYGLDFSFFRVYDEDGKPLKTKHYFKWSPNGAADGEPVFVVGNPGKTGRLRTIAQLEYARDINYPLSLLLLTNISKLYRSFIDTEKPENKDELEDTYYMFTNSLKALSGVYGGLKNDVLMQKKRLFEKQFKEAVNSKPELAAKYSDLWAKIEATRAEMRPIGKENAAYNLNPYSSSAYFKMAREIVDLAYEMKEDAGKNDSSNTGDNLKLKAKSIFPDDFQPVLSKMLTSLNIKMIKAYLGEDHPLVKDLTGGKGCDEAAESMIKNTILTSAESLARLAEKGADSILNSNDPFIAYVVKTRDRAFELKTRIAEITARENEYLQKLGQALFEVYGTEIPPDATFTLRIADGIVQGYDYNGTIAPSHTTFYGLYDRYYSHDKKFPWNLPARWLNPPKEFNLETPMVFVSTNDIIGGNSGSPVINRNAEIVGLAFDGNIESLPGEFIFSTDLNRSVSVHSAGLIEALQDMYRATRLSKELRAGKIVK